MPKFKWIGIVFLSISLQSTSLNSVGQGTSTGQGAQTPTPQWRPRYHFSPPANWTNDPNGLIYLNGKFNLYYQHNPFENKWGHMSWGHATSTDLVHWENLPVAIPEVVTPDTTTWIYSGSAVLDKNNTSGFGTGSRPPIVAIFTADQPKQKKESQFIAYSNDGGLHYQLYPGNPVIDLNKKDFRDPNVFWYEPARQWIMTVAMVDEHMVRIYGSKDLKTWTKLSDFGPAGYTRHGWECPSLLPLTVDNDPAKTKWVLFVSCFGGHGPMMQYYIGDFDGTTFTNNNSADKVLTVDEGDAFYAAIAWRDAPGNKKILLGWLQNGKRETYPWKGQQSIPRDLSVKTTPEGLRLFQPPTDIITGSLTKHSKGRLFAKKDLLVKGQGTAPSSQGTTSSSQGIDLSSAARLSGNSYWIDADIEVDKATQISFDLAATPDGGKKVQVGYDPARQELFVDCSSSEKENKSPDNLVHRTPLRMVNGRVKIQILLDGSSLEVFGNDGEKAISTMIYPDKDARGLSLHATGGALVKNLKIWNLD